MTKIELKKRLEKMNDHNDLNISISALGLIQYILDHYDDFTYDEINDFIFYYEDFPNEIDWLEPYLIFNEKFNAITDWKFFEQYFFLNMQVQILNKIENSITFKLRKELDLENNNLKEEFKKINRGLQCFTTVSFLIQLSGLFYYIIDHFYRFSETELKNFLHLFKNDPYELKNKKHPQEIFKSFDDGKTWGFFYDYCFLKVKF